MTTPPKDDERSSGDGGRADDEAAGDEPRDAARAVGGKSDDYERAMEELLEADAEVKRAPSTSADADDDDAEGGLPGRRRAPAPPAEAASEIAFLDIDDRLGPRAGRADEAERLVAHQTDDRAAPANADILDADDGRAAARRGARDVPDRTRRRAGDDDIVDVGAVASPTDDDRRAGAGPGAIDADVRRAPLDADILDADDRRAPLDADILDADHRQVPADVDILDAVDAADPDAAPADGDVIDADDAATAAAAPPRRSTVAESLGGSHRSRYDAVVVGAGPAGSATAILLARAGWSVALVERQRFPRRKVCGECVAASNLALLDALGIGPAFAEAAGAELTRVVLMHGAEAIEAPLPRGDDPARPYGRALGRDRLDTLLVDAARAAGVSIWQPWSVQRIDGRPGSFRVRLLSMGGDDFGLEPRLPIEIGAALVVGAQGSWEPLPGEREAARAAREEDDLLAFKANFRSTKIAEGSLPVLAFAGGYGGMVVESGGLATIACCVRADRLAAAREAGGRAGDVVERVLVQACRGVADALEHATRDGAWLATGAIRPGIRVGRRGGVGRYVFLVGNAAGEAHPIVGEGISMALQSAFVLTSVVGPARDALIADPGLQRAAMLRYEALWRRRFGPRMRVAALFAHAAMRPRLTPWLLALLRRRPDLLTRGAVWAGKTQAVPEAALVAPVAAPIVS